MLKNLKNGEFYQLSFKLEDGNIWVYAAIDRKECKWSKFLDFAFVILDFTFSKRQPQKTNFKNYE